MNGSSRPGRRARLSRAAAAVLFALAAALAAGCSAVPERDVLARVGDRVVTADDFRAIAKDNVAQYPFAPDSAKHALLDDMVRRELLVVEGQRLRYDRDSTLVKGRRASDDDILSRALFEKITAGPAAVSDSEVALFHRWRGTQSHLLLLYTPARDAAARALAAIQGGRPFGEVSTEVSLPGMLPPGGDVSWVSAGQLVDPLDALAREAPIGVPQGPLASPTGGWFLAMVTERRTQPIGKLEEEKPYLVEMLRQRKQRSIAMKAFQELREQYQVKVEPRGAQALFQVGNAPGTEPPKVDEREVIATYDGGSSAKGAYTLGDAMRDLDNPSGERPPFQSTAALQAWLDGQVLQRVAVIEARRRRLDQDPDIARRMRGRVENTVVQRVYEERVAKGLEISDAEVLAHYAARAAAFASPGAGAAATAPPEFAKLPAPLQQNLRQEALANKREVRLREVTAEIRRTVKRFEVHPERLKRIDWPQPAQVPGPPGGAPAGQP